MLLVNCILNFDSMFITSPKKSFGLDISDLSIKAVEIEQQGSKRYIKAMKSTVIPDGLISDGVIQDEKKVAKIIRKLVETGEKINTQYAVVSLPETKTFIKVIEITENEENRKSASELIKEELPKHMPISVEQAHLDWQPVYDQPKKKKFLVGAVEEEIADSYVRLCHQAGLEIVALEIEAEAIMRAITRMPSRYGVIQKLMGRINGGEKNENKNEGKKKKRKAEESGESAPKIIVDLGAHRAGLILAENGIIQFSNSLQNISGKMITEIIAQKKNLTFAEAEKVKLICGSNPKKCRGAVLETVQSMLDEIAREIINAIEFYQTHFKRQADIEVILVGGGANMSGIEKTLQDKLKRPVSIGRPLINVEIGQKGEKHKNILAYTTAIGLALRRFVDNY